MRWFFSRSSLFCLRFYTLYAFRVALLVAFDSLIVSHFVDLNFSDIYSEYFFIIIRTIHVAPLITDVNSSHESLNVFFFLRVRSM